MKSWGLILFFLIAGVYAQEENRVVPLETWQLVQQEDAIFPEWLQAQREVFLQRAIFDFGQAFFRIRGMDPRFTEQRFNGFPMNSLYDGRPEWQQWAGLNDATRNERYLLGIQRFETGFGGMQGVRSIWTEPASSSMGTRITLSQTNRNYRNRVMLSHTGALGTHWSYAMSFSRRWAREGYVQGTPYDAWAGYLGLEWQPNPGFSLVLTGIWNTNTRVRMPALTREVNQLKGNTYNPWWGFWKDEKRVANGRRFASPLFMAHIKRNQKNFEYRAGIAFRDSRTNRDRLGYYNASNPNPTYYRYVPSFYLNSPIGADYLGANAAREAFLSDGQLNWENLVRANTNPNEGGSASYILYGDHKDTQRFSVYGQFGLSIGAQNKVSFGGYSIREDLEFYAAIADLLGASYHEDIDPFTETANDLDGSIQKGEGESFNYRYGIITSQNSLFGQWQVTHKKWQYFLAGSWLGTQLKREGVFRNGRFPQESAGESEALHFDGFGAKSGLRFALDGRHEIRLNGMYNRIPPTVRNAFINPRAHNGIVPDLQSETILGIELTYRFRLPGFWGRITGFENHTRDRTGINAFYVDSGLGSEFIQEVATGIDVRYRGMEWALKYQVSADVALDLAGSLGRYTYASDPQIRMYYDPTELPEGSGEITSFQDLGMAAVQGYHLGQGPETALAMGMTYNDPEYWWIGLSLNYMCERYLRPTFITRTASFLLDPETGQAFPEAGEEEVTHVLKQTKLPALYLMNLIGGKSWKIKDKYISLFLSCSNVFDLQFATGGYEQGRNGNYGQMIQDLLSGHPSFGPKYWYNQGRSFFVNVSVRL